MNIKSTNISQSDKFIIYSASTSTIAKVFLRSLQCVGVGLSSLLAISNRTASNTAPQNEEGLFDSRK